MTPLERIRLLCKKSGISMTALEEKLEFSNGSISKPKGGVRYLISDSLLGGGFYV